MRWLMSLVLVLTACGRVPAPGIPESDEIGADIGKTLPRIENGKVYTGENGSLDSIGGTLPSGAETDPLEMGGDGIPKMDPVVMEPEVPVPTDPKPVPSDPSTDPRSFRTISVFPGENRGVWEGFGANLGAWANAVGASEFQDTYADLLFTNRNTAFTNMILPGLGLTIVRYGIGGGGRALDIMDLVENNPQDFAAYRHVEGYWTNPASDDAATSSFDWTRDAHQRSMLTAAKDRGVKTFEFYSMAPMWWMTSEKTAVGGKLESPANFAKYLAAVTKQARDEWAIPVSSLAPFNEPTSERWLKEFTDQGSFVDGTTQGEILGELQKELLVRDLAFTVGLSGSDEANPKAAVNTHGELQAQELDVYEKVNVHTAERGQPSRDINAKEGLRIAVGEKRIWVSDHTDASIDGMSLASSIVEDINTMQATAWIYGQPVDSMSTKGLVLGNFEMNSELESVRGRPRAISVKHYILAQFSRFIRPGQQIVGGSDDKSLIAYDPTSHRLSVIILNTGKTQQDVDIDLSAFKSWSTSITHVVTRGDGMKVWKAKSAGVLSKKVRVNVEAGSVSSLEIPDAILK